MTYMNFFAGTLYVEYPEQQANYIPLEAAWHRRNLVFIKNPPTL